MYSSDDEEFISADAQKFFGGRPEQKRIPELDFVEYQNKKDALRERLKYNNKIFPPRLKLDMKDPRRLKYIHTIEKTQSLKYQKRAESIHIGQRKLGICEIQNLTEVLDNKDEYAVVIYAGSAPTNKAWFEHTLFPNVKFLLVDPNMFNIYITDYRDSHYYHADEVGIVYYGISTTNYNSSYEVKSFAVNYFDGQHQVRIDDKYANSAFNKDIIGDPTSADKWGKYIDHFYNSDNSIFINEAFFMDGTAEFCKKLSDGRQGKYKDCKIIFWCDLRTSDEGSGPTDLDILFNLAMMYNWLKVIRPDHSMLKFRTPFKMVDPSTLDYSKYDSIFSLAIKNGNDFVGHYNQTSNIKYFPGDIYIQCWEGRKSTETRLWVTKDQLDELVEYDRVAYEEILCYYNCIERIVLKHENPYLDRTIGMDRCGDCAIEGHVWQRYKEKMDPEIDVKWWMNWLSEITTRPLTRGGHGLFL